MKKKFILIIFLISVFVIVGCTNNGQSNNQTPIISENICNIDSDCVPATCCHAKTCINKENKPNCNGMMCTQECASGTLDCGQGSCKCQNNKCTAIITGSNTQIANPASVYCEDNKGRLEIRTNEQGQYGVCIFSDNSECEEWAYYRGECKPGQLKQA